MAGELYRDVGVVLRTYKLRESDRIVVLMTAENGKVRAVAKGVLQPGTKPGLGPVHRGKHIGHLFADLKPVAAIDEHARDVLRDGHETGRAGKAGQPGQPFIRRGDVFALMPVGARHEEGVQTVPCHFGAQGGEAWRALFG